MLLVIREHAGRVLKQIRLERRFTKCDGHTAWRIQVAILDGVRKVIST